MRPDSPHEVQEQLAQAYYLKGLRNDAIKLYEELVYQKGYRQALLGLGEAKDDSGDPRFAVTAYDEFLAAERHDRNKAIAHVKKGLALAHMHRHEEALNEYEAALKYAPRDILVLVHEGLERAEATDLDSGIAQLKSVVEENQNSDSAPFARLQLGALLERKGDWPGAIEEYKMAAHLLPNYVEAHLRLANALVHENKGARAFDEYNKVAKLSASDLERGYSDIFANQWLANELRNLGNYADAASAYRKAIRFKSDNSAAHCQLSLIRARQGHLSEAISEYGAALVPAKVQEFNDKDCLTLVDHVLDQAVASPGPDHKQAVAELRKVRERTNGTTNNLRYATAENALGSPIHKGKVIEQAALRSDLGPK
jgi:tetratricopeptide (TPR) repeat protein